MDNNFLSSNIIYHRRNLHKIPEIGTYLPQTQHYLQSQLEKIGIPYTCNQADSGLIAVLETGRSGPTIVYRSDMDALPIRENTSLSFSSTNGAMHACGHDAHMAILLSTIELLWEQRAHLFGQFLFLFQTGEETAEGARLACQEPVFQHFHPDRIYGFHIGRIHPGIQHGQLGIASGIRMASYDKFIIQIQGKGTHGSTPELGIDPIYIASVLIQQLSSITTKECSVFQPNVISIGKVLGGDTYNIIPDTCTIEGTFRAQDTDTRSFLANRITEMAATIATVFHTSSQTQIVWGAPPVYNDPAVTEQVQKVAFNLFSPTEVITDFPPIMVGEDFSVYQQNIPGTYIFLGVNPPDNTPAFPHHNPQFDIDDSILWKIARLFYQLGISYLPPNS